jgi:thiol-disulfide isomerase/thioredoxin
MKNKSLLVFAGILLLACSFLFPQTAYPTQKPAVALPTKTMTLLNDNQPLKGFTIVRLHPSDGDLQAMLADEAQKAAALGQLPVVEFDATWCPPCKAIENLFQEKNELMLRAYDSAYIIKLDVDEWVWEENRVQNFEFQFIPVYFKLDSQGRPTGDKVDGSAWDEDIPENIAPVMDQFFHGT